MNRWIASALALVALFAGGILFGWKGVVLVMTMLIAWLLVQFARLMKLMGMASKGPVGRVASAAALNGQIRERMKMVDLLPLTGSLGRKVSDAPQRYDWTDAGGARVEVELADGRVLRWTLIPADQPAP